MRDLSRASRLAMTVGILLCAASRAAHAGTLAADFETPASSPLTAAVGLLGREERTAFVHSGRYSLRMTSTESDARTAAWRPGVEVAPGEPIRLEAWVRAESAAAQVGMTLACENEAGQRSPEAAAVRRVSAAATWRPVRLEHVCPVEFPQPQVRLALLTPAASIWWDDVSLLPAREAANVRACQFHLRSRGSLTPRPAALRASAAWARGDLCRQGAIWAAGRRSVERSHGASRGLGAPSARPAPASRWPAPEALARPRQRRHQSGDESI